jgi:uncharacterized membrane protein
MRTSSALGLLTCTAIAAMSAACGREEATSSTATQPVQTPAVSAPPASPEDLESESALSIKRGVVTLTAQTRSFRLCGSNVDLTLTDQLDGALDTAYMELGGKPMYAEVYGERGEAQPGSVAPNSFNVEDLLYANGSNVATACASPLGRYELLARGNDPTWSVEISQDTLLFRQTGAPTQIEFTGAETADAEGTVTYRAGVDKYVLELTVAQRACHDTAANEYYAYTATARLNKLTFNGCARVGE